MEQGNGEMAENQKRLDGMTRYGDVSSALGCLYSQYQSGAKVPAILVPMARLRISRVCARVADARLGGWPWPVKKFPVRRRRCHGAWWRVPPAPAAARSLADVKPYTVGMKMAGGVEKWQMLPA